EGAAHFIEHMMFKGTKRRKDTMTISRDLDAHGADYNAFTGKDYTGYYIRMEADKLPLAVDMLSDMLHHSLYRPGDIKSERKVIHEEIRMYEDNPAMSVDEILEEELFRGSTLGKKITGTVETMNGIERSPMLAFRDTYYVPQRTVVAIAGKFERASAMKLLEKTFGKRSAAKKEPPRFAQFHPEKAGYQGVRVRISHKKTEQVQVALGWPSYGRDDKRRAVLTIMGVILGGNMSSRLFTEVREKRGLAYSVRAGNGTYQDIGAFTIQAGLSKDKVHDALGVITSEVKKLKTTLVGAAELLRAKDYLRGKMLLGLEDSNHMADWYARQELLDRRIETPEMKLKRLDAVTAAQIRDAAREIFIERAMGIAVIGPYDEAADKQGFAKHAAALY
ncbi:MAG: hypothetical protein RLZZ324_1145, partial [Candidatus Parcubacteria bacterium]